MKIKVRFFAAPREMLGAGELVQELPAESTVQTLMDALIRTYPKLGSLPLKFAVNRAYASLDTQLCDGDEVACIPPVGGG